MWFALDGEISEYKYSYNYQNWYPSQNMRPVIIYFGLFDLTPFSKFETKSDKAHEELQRICKLMSKMKLVNVHILTC